jgi:hypothetical protein
VGLPKYGLINESYPKWLPDVSAYKYILHRNSILFVDKATVRFKTVDSHTNKTVYHLLVYSVCSVFGQFRFVSVCRDTQRVHGEFHLTNLFFQGNSEGSTSHLPTLRFIANYRPHKLHGSLKPCHLMNNKDSGLVVNSVEYERSYGNIKRSDESISTVVIFWVI